MKKPHIMKSLRDIIMLYHSISDESYEKLDQIMEVKEYKRKTELNNSNKFFILKKGFVRSSTFDEKGNRKTGNILSESSIFTSIKPLPLNKNNSSLEIKFCCMSDVILYEGCFIKFLELTKTHHNLSLFLRRDQDERDNVLQPGLSLSLSLTDWIFVFRVQRSKISKLCGSQNPFYHPHF